MSDKERGDQVMEQLERLMSKASDMPKGEAPLLNIGLTPEVLSSLRNRADMLSRMQKGRITAKERLSALLSDDLQLADPVAAEAFRRVVGVLGALLGVEVDDEK